MHAIARSLMAVLCVSPGLAAGGAALAQSGGPSSSETAVPGAPLALSYELHAGGLHAFSIDTEVTLAPERYALDLELRTDGWLSWILDWSLSSRAAGRADDAGLRPERFRTESRWRGKPRWVELRYDGGPAPRVEVEPPQEEDDRDPVPEALRADTLDPLTAGLALVHALMTGGRCEGEAAVFDGRRRFDAQAEDAGSAEVPVSDLAPYGGEAVACRLNVVPVTGFWRDERNNTDPQELLVYLRPVIEGQPPVPVRVEAETRFGAVRVHLVSAGLAPGRQRAALGD